MKEGFSNPLVIIIGAGPTGLMLGKFLRHDQQLFVLVRPDRYIFGVLREEQAGEFVFPFFYK